MKDGSTLWDVWAVAAMILEEDMMPGEYFGVSTERGAQQKAEEHTKEKETSPALRVLLSHTMLRAEVSTMEGLHFIRKQLQNVLFRKYPIFRVERDHQWCFTHHQTTLFCLS